MTGILYLSSCEIVTSENVIFNIFNNFNALVNILCKGLGLLSFGILMLGMLRF